MRLRAATAGAAGTQSSDDRHGKKYACFACSGILTVWTSNSTVEKIDFVTNSIKRDYRAPGGGARRHRSGRRDCSEPGSGRKRRQGHGGCLDANLGRGRACKQLCLLMRAIGTPACMPSSDISQPCLCSNEIGSIKTLSEKIINLGELRTMPIRILSQLIQVIHARAKLKLK